MFEHRSMFLEAVHTRTEKKTGLPYQRLIMAFLPGLRCRDFHSSHMLKGFSSKDLLLSCWKRTQNIAIPSFDRFGKPFFVHCHRNCALYAVIPIRTRIDFSYGRPGPPAVPAISISSFRIEFMGAGISRQVNLCEGRNRRLKPNQQRCLSTRTLICIGHSLCRYSAQCEPSEHTN